MTGPTQAAAGDDAALPEDLSGLTLDGRYDVADALVRSNGRTSYAAREQPGDRPVVVLAFSRPVGADAASRRQFLEHVRSMQDIHHPAVPAVLAAGTLPGDGRPYLVEEHVEGRTLREELQRVGTFPAERTAQILRRVAHALAFCRAHGVTHGNLKPENILLSGAALERVHVLEVGVARLMRCRPGTTGMVPGTPRYMAPELVTPGTPDESRADVYALGVLAFEMATGRVPFDAPDSAALLQLHATAPVPAFKDVQPACKASQWMEQLVGRMLRKKPAERPAMADLQEEIEHLPDYLEEISDDLAPAGAPALNPLDIRIDARSMAPAGAAEDGHGTGIGIGLTTGEMARPTAPARSGPPMGAVLGVGGALVVMVVAFAWPASEPKAPAAQATPADAGTASEEPSSVELDVDGITLRGGKKASATRGTASTPAARPASPAAVAPAVAPAAAASTVVLTLTSEPPGADVLDGETLLGTTPAKIELPRGDIPRLLVVRLGNRQQLRPFRPQADATLHVVLPAADAPTPDTPAPANAAPAADAPAPQPEPEETPPPAVKTAEEKAPDPAPAEPAAESPPPAAEKTAADKPAEKPAPEQPAEKAPAEKPAAEKAEEQPAEKPVEAAPPGP